MVKDGVVLEEQKKGVNEAGFVTDENRVPLDLMNDLRRILMNNGIRDKRESIIELFEYEDPANWQRLNEILAQADVTPSKRKMVVDLWRRRTSDLDEATYEEQEQEDDGYVGYGGDMRDDRQAKKKRSPMAITPDDMANWQPGDYMKWAMDAQKYISNQQMMMGMLNKMFGSMGVGMDMGMGGGGNANARVPPELQAKLNRLEQLEEESRFQKAMEPILKRLDYMRAENEDKKPKADPMTEIKEMAVTMRLMETIGSKEGAEVLRMQMDERLEKMRLESQKSLEETRMRMEGMREQNSQLQLKSIQTEMGAKIDMMKQAYDIASQSKKEDLLSTITKAKEINEALKTITGDTKTPDDKKMEAIGSIIDNATKTLSPVLQTLAQNIGQPKPAAGPGNRMPSQMRGMQGQMQQPSGSIALPPLMPGQRAVAQCTAQGCTADIDVDPNKPIAQCLNCGASYHVTKQQQAITPVSQPQSPEALQQKRYQLLDLPREELDEAARQLNLVPEQHHTKEELVEALLRNRFGAA
jgi:hypothetical protein